MDQDLEERKSAFLAGDWLVEPELNCLRQDGIERHIEPKVMRVLLLLVARHNHVVSKKEIITSVWPDTFVSDDVLTRCISILRKITDDDPQAPRFIQTVPKVGYRLVAPITELPITPAVLEPVIIEATHVEPVNPVVGPAPLLGLTPPPTHRAPALLLIAISLLLVAAAITLWLIHRTPQAQDAHRSFRTLQFTSYDGEQTQPAFSPDGRIIAYVRTTETNSTPRIYLKQIGTEATTELLPGGTDQQFSPVWSPDSHQIAWLSRSGSNLGLFVTTVGASAPPQLLFMPQEPSHWNQNALSWSPDGKSLIFPDHQGSEPNSSIYLLDLATRKARSITTPPSGWEGDLNPAWSPDGKSIAFTRASETAVRDIFVLQLVTGNLRQLTHDRMNIDSLTWNADGSAIVFSSNRGGKYALWEIALDATEPERLPIGTEDAFQPATGPRPGQFAYSQGSAIWSILRLHPSNAKEPSTRNSAESILSSTLQDSAPSLAPNGRSFAIQSHRSGSQEIWIASITGEGLRQLTSFGGPVTGSPAWSSHNDLIAFDSRPDGHSHIFVVPAAGGPPKQLTFGDANDIVPRWSHDDALLYFRSNRGGRWQLWKLPSTGGEPQPVTTNDGIEPQESPDGRYLYYTRGDEDGLWRTATIGGHEEKVLDQPSAGFWGYWQITPQGLFYLDRTEATPAIRILDPATGQRTLFTRLQQMPPPYAGLTVADGGKAVLITSQRAAGRHITLVESDR